MLTGATVLPLLIGAMLLVALDAAPDSELESEIESKVLVLPLFTGATVAADTDPEFAAASEMPVPVEVTTGLEVEFEPETPTPVPIPVPVLVAVESWAKAMPPSIVDASAARINACFFIAPTPVGRLAGRHDGAPP